MKLKYKTDWLFIVGIFLLILAIDINYNIYGTNVVNCLTFLCLFLYHSFYLVKEYEFSYEIHTRRFIFVVCFIGLFGISVGALYFKLWPGIECNIITNKNYFDKMLIVRFDDKRLIGLLERRVIILSSDKIEQIRCGSFSAYSNIKK